MRTPSSIGTSGGWTRASSSLIVTLVNDLGDVVMVGVAAAVANAVFHATGTRVRHLPIRVEDPYEA